MYLCNMKKRNLLTIGMMLLVAADCMGQKGNIKVDVTSKGKVSASDTLSFKAIHFSDSLIADMKIIDYSSDEEPYPFTMGKSRNYYEAYTLEAVGGRPEAVAFINQWLLCNQANRSIRPPVGAETVAEKYAELKAEGLGDMNSVLKSVSRRFLEEDLLEESSFETGNQHYNGISVVMNTPNVLTILDHGSNYAAGAAHGMPWGFLVTFDLKNLRQLMFDDIISEEGREAVLEMIVEDLRENYGEEGLTDAIDFPGCDPALTEEGVQFDYQSYEIGPYSMGMPTVVVPYEKIRKYLTPQVRALL